MELTQGINFAFHGLVVLASSPPEQPMGIGKVAKTLGASPTYMAKLFQPLVKSGLVTSRRGPRGGFVLAKSPEEITMRLVLEALQISGGPGVALPWCTSCVLGGACPVKGTLRDTEQTLLAALDRITVADVTNRIQVPKA